MRSIAVVCFWVWILSCATATHAQQALQLPPLQCDDSALAARYQTLQGQEKAILKSLASTDVPSDDKIPLSADATKQIEEARTKLNEIKREQLEIYSKCDKSQSKANERAAAARAEKLKKVRANARGAQPADAAPNTQGQGK